MIGRTFPRAMSTPRLRGWLAFALLAWAFVVQATTVPTLHARVNDNAGVLGGRAAAIEEKLALHEQRTGEQVVVLTVSDLGGQDIESYANEVFSAWKLGHKGVDNGVLVVVATGDRRARIEVGYGLEGTLTDLDSSRILRERMHPLFAAGDYAGGVDAGVDAILAVLASEPPPPMPPHDTHAAIPIWVSIFVFFMLTLFSLMAASGGGWYTLWVTPACSLFLLVLLPLQAALIIFALYMVGVYVLRRRWMHKAWAGGSKARKRSGLSAMKAWPPTFLQVMGWMGGWTSGGSGTGSGHDGGSLSSTSSSSDSSSSSDFSGGGGDSGGGGASDSW